MSTQTTKNSQIAKPLGIFSLAMMTAVSVDSVRNLPAVALFGSTLIFFFIFSALVFLLPTALVSAELASTSKETGGVYTWIKNAFGSQFGVLAVWFQWAENVIWYPTILSFVAGTIGYLIAPQLADNKYFLMIIILCSFWFATIINLLGIESSARFSNICAVFGLLLPMALIISLGFFWIYLDQPLQIHFAPETFLPNLTDQHVWVALTGIIMSFCGMEIATVHGRDVQNPQRAYPRAMLIATLIIVVTLLCGALAIAIVLPQKEISLVAGIMQAFHAFFAVYHLEWMLPLVAAMLVFGVMGGISNWIIAPARGLFIAARDGHLPKVFGHQNRFQSPSFLLIGQAVLVSLISLIFLLMPSVNASYWLLTALAAQIYMLMYILLFVAGIRLRYSKNVMLKTSGFQIPGPKNCGMWIVGIIGIIGSIITFIVGFIPPYGISIGSVSRYEMLLLFGLIIMSVPPFIMYQITSEHSKINKARRDRAEKSQKYSPLP